jgi:hypothetical protein
MVGAPVKRKRRKAKPKSWNADERALDRALEGTFPASDPPAQTDPSRGIRHEPAGS